MEVTTMQNLMQGSVVSESGRSRSSGRGVLGGMSADPFAEIFLRMAEAMAEGTTEGEEGSSEQGLGMDAMFGGNNPMLGEADAMLGEADPLLMEEFAAMLYANPTMISQIPAQLSQEIQQRIELANAVETAEQKAFPQEILKENPLAVAGQKSMTQTEESKSREVPAFMLNQEETTQVKGGENKMPLGVQDVTAMAKGKVDSQQEIMSVERQFSAAIETAKRQMQEGKEQEPVERDAFTLKPEVMTETAGRKEVPVAKPHVAEQIQTELKTHLEKGDSEFTMKLKPEALGEITIKMIKTEGKVVVQIVTASQQTSQMLNKDIGILREALRPLQADVQTVTSVEGSSIQQGTEQFNMQHFAEQQNHNASQHNKQVYYGDGLYAEEEILQEEAVQLDESNLSIYI